MFYMDEMIPEHIDKLIKTFNILPELNREQAALKLEILGEEAVYPLIEALTIPRYSWGRIAAGIIDVLGRIGNIEATEQIIDTLAMASLWPYREKSIRALIKIGEKTDGEKTNYETVVRCVREALNDEICIDYPIFRARLLYVLGCLIKHSVLSPEILGDVSKYQSIFKNEIVHPCKEVRVSAAYALFHLKKLWIILKALHLAKDADIRKATALILKDIAHEIILFKRGRDDIRKIKRALNRARYDDDKGVRNTARDSLKSIDNAIQMESDSIISPDRMQAAFMKIFKDIVITEEDCGTSGVPISDIIQKGDVIRNFKDRIINRYSSCDVRSLQKGEIIIKRGELITRDIANRIEKTGQKMAVIKTIIHCQAKNGICLKCFGGHNFAGDKTKIGDNIGSEAASWWAKLKLNKHSIDILKARRPADPAILCELDEGLIIFKDEKDMTRFEVGNEKGFYKKYKISQNQTVLLSDSEFAYMGQELTSSKPDPKDVFRIRGVVSLAEYIIDEMLRYMPRSNFDERLIELFVKESIKVKIIDPGVSKFKKGQIVTMRESIAENKALPSKSKHAICDPFFAGIQFK